jgi:xylulokinase
MTDRPAYLGLDVGGTGAKAGVFDGAGRLLGFGRARYAASGMGAGHAEVDIEELYAAARDAARQAVRDSGRRPAALSIASMGQTFVALDGAGRPVCPAILWYDARAAAEAAELARALQAAGPSGDGWPAPYLDALATAAKIVWLRRHAPEAAQRARYYFLAPDYLAYRLTGEAVTDTNTASSTGLYADGAPGYDPRALAAAGVDAAALARIQPPGSPIAPVRDDLAREWGLAPGALLAAGTNDQYAGALGAGNCRPGIVTETTGTCLALVTLAERLPDPLPPGILAGRYPIPPYQFALAYAKTAGLVLDWFRETLSPGRSLADLEALAAQAPPGSRGVTVLPHFDGMVSPAPHAGARGAMLNLTLGHTLADLYRAILESVAFSLRENLALFHDHGLRASALRAIGGGARSDLWLQIKADVTGRAIERPAVTEAATLGAAMLAAVGCGAYGSLAESSAGLYHVERVFEPDERRAAQYEEPYRAYRDLCRALYEPAGT